MEHNKVSVISSVQLQNAGDENSSHYIINNIEGFELSDLQSLLQKHVNSSPQNNHSVKILPNSTGNDGQLQYEIEFLDPKPKKLAKKRKPPQSTTIRNDSGVVCEMCGMFASTINSLNRHKKEHNFKKPHKCSQCPESFNFSENLQLHIFIHGTNLSLTCPKCDIKFNRSSSLHGHLKSHYRPEYFECNFCEEIFLTKAFLKSHFKASHQNVMERNKRLVETNIRKLAMKKEQLVNNRTCKICQKAFKKPYILGRHMRKHTGEKPYRCHRCGSHFTQKISLDLHMLRHDGIKPYSCSECFLQFTQKGNLNIHMRRVHQHSADSDEVRFPCTHCSCVYTKLGSLNRHITEYHSARNRDKSGAQAVDYLSEDNREETNEIINIEKIMKQIAQLQNMDNNKQDTNNDIEVSPTRTDDIPKKTMIRLADRVEEKQVIYRNIGQIVVKNQRYLLCPHCEKIFIRPSDLLRHIRVHEKDKPFSCYLCQRKFSLNRTLHLHMKTHESSARNKFSCSLCEKFFKKIDILSLHINKIHADEAVNSNLYQCSQCKSTFSNPDDLVVHSKRLSCNNSSNNEENIGDIIEEQHVETVTDSLVPLEFSENIVGLDPTQELYILMESPESTTEPIFISQSNFIFENVDEAVECVIINSEPPQSVNEIIPADDELQNIEETDVLPTDVIRKDQNCRFCDRFFKKPIDLRRHERKHTGEKPFKCVKCDKAFSLASTLKHHEQTHAAVREKIRCHICAKEFSSKTSLKLHISIHTGVKAYNCQYCGIKFRTPGHRISHENIHIKLARERGVEPSEVRTRSSKFDIYNMDLMADQFLT